MKRSIVLSVISIENSKPLEYHIFLIKQQFLILFVIGVAVTVNMAEENIMQKFRLKNIEETKNYFINYFRNKPKLIDE